MPRWQPRPFEQGMLDGLCGIYSIINGLLWAQHTSRFTTIKRPKQARTLREVEVTELFIHLLSALVQRRAHLRSVVDGVNNRDLARLIRHSSRWLIERSGVAFTSHRPFLGRARIATSRVACALAEHLATPGSAVIVGLECPWDHWTVVRKATPGRLLLLDSSGESQLLLRACGQHCTSHSSLLRPDNVFLLRLTHSTAAYQASS